MLVVVASFAYYYGSLVPSKNYGNLGWIEPVILSSFMDIN